MKKVILSTMMLASLTVSAATTNEAKYEQLISQHAKQKVNVTHVKDTPMPGVKEVVVNGAFGNEVFYLSEDGSYLIEGQMLDMKAGVNLKQKTEKSLRKEVMADHKGQLQSIDFFPETMTDHVTVFTDIDCGYCRKLHQEVEQYNDLGIGISYVFFPRGGLQSPAYDKAVNVWCSADKKQAMTLAKAGGEIEPKMCKNPITSQFNLAIQAGVHKVGTPSVVTADGTLIRGYLPPTHLKQRLEAQKAGQ